MTETDVPATRRLAPRWRRFVAFLVDLFFLWLTCWGIGSLIGEVLIPVRDWARLIGFGVMAAYFTWWDSYLGSGASPGKRLFGIHVLDMNGNELYPTRAAIRAVMIAPTFVLPGVYSAPPNLKYLLVGAALWGALGASTSQRCTFLCSIAGPARVPRLAYQYPCTPL